MQIFSLNQAWTLDKQKTTGGVQSEGFCLSKDKQKTTDGHILNFKLTNLEKKNCQMRFVKIDKPKLMKY